MAKEKTFSIIKPDAVKKNVIGKILSLFEDNGLKIIAGKLITISKSEAEEFYGIHKERPFFGELIEYITSGPVFTSVLEGENAVAHHRELMGATDPKKANPGTIRALYGENIGTNAVHGSDSSENATIEIRQFFPSLL